MSEGVRVALVLRAVRSLRLEFATSLRAIEVRLFAYVERHWNFHIPRSADSTFAATNRGIPGAKGLPLRYVRG